MPFKSKKQSKACFATKGFGRKIDCKKWAKETNYKSLKMRGGKYRKMQDGGSQGQYLLDGSWQPGYIDKNGAWVDTGPVVPASAMKQNSVSPAKPTPKPTVPAYNPLGESPWIAKGQSNPLAPPPSTPVPIGAAPGYRPPAQWHNTPEDIDPLTGSTFDERLPDDHPDNPGTGQSVGTYTSRANASVTETTTQTPRNWNQDIFLGLRGAQLAATYLSGKKRDKRMDEYDYKQQTALGMMNPMPISAFQYNQNNYTTPNRMYAEQGGVMNPYSYHAKYGGNLKRIIKDYKKWSNDVNPMDMGEGHIDNQGLMQIGGYPNVRNQVLNTTGTPVESLQLQLRKPNTVVAMPGGSSIAGDSTRYMPGLANQFGVPYVIDQIGVKGNAALSPMDFLDVDPKKMRVYQDSILGKVNGFQRKKGGFALDEMVVNDFVRKLMQFGRGPHPYRGYGKKYEKGGKINYRGK